MVGTITSRPKRPRRLPPVALLLASIALFAILWWVIGGPDGSVSGQPCHRGWLRIVVAQTDQDQARGWTLLRHAIVPVGGPQASRVYVRPEPGASDSIRDITLLAFRVWAPGRDAASVQRSLDDTGSTPISVEPLCGSLGATELIIPVAMTVILCALVFVVAIWWYRFRQGAS